MLAPWPVPAPAIPISQSEWFNRIKTQRKRFLQLVHREADIHLYVVSRDSRQPLKNRPMVCRAITCQWATRSHARATSEMMSDFMQQGKRERVGSNRRVESEAAKNINNTFAVRTGRLCVYRRDVIKKANGNRGKTRFEELDCPTQERPARARPIL